MLAFLIRRILLLLPVLFLVSAISFTLFYLAPGDPAELLLTGPQGPPDPAAVQELRQKAGFDDPPQIQYIRWLNKAIRGDLGYSFITGDKVLDDVRDSFRSTLKLALASLVISFLISIPLGILSAVKRNSAIDNLAMTLSLLGVSVPNFWLAYLLIIFFAIQLDVLPVAGYGESGDLEHMVLPAVTLGLSAAAVTSRMMRSCMLEVLSQDYILAARAKGLPNWSVVLKHALPNALLPVITVMGLNFTYLLNGSAVVETVFAWPGIGNLMIHSIYDRDYPVIMGSLLFLATLFLILNLLIDVFYYYLNPRMRD
ncbi:MAG: nickel transporter permease NikB [Methanosaeta sp. PtaU1.Bin060]|jgi:peptide/nickel transport system permease protein|nr:MAG: nickel transporter permease NikB [Methanosaeta sp. PtaU1.Bin060]